MSTKRAVALSYLVLGTGILATLILHAVLVPRYFPDEPLLTLVLLGIGWGTFTVACYTAGRLFSSPAGLPNMRAGDYGVALLLLSLLAIGVLATVQLTPAVRLDVYVPPLVGIYVGLALIGWAIGQRTEAINRLVNDE